MFSDVLRSSAWQPPRGAAPTTRTSQRAQALNKYEKDTFCREFVLAVTYAVTLTFDPLTLNRRIGRHVLKLCAKFERNRSMHARVIAI